MRKKIKVFKPGFTVTSDNNKDSSSVLINPEILNLAQVLARDFEVVIVSPSDFARDGNPRSGELDEPADINILCEGRLYKKGDAGDARVDIELEEIEEVFREGANNFRFVTDWKIYQKNKGVLDDDRFNIVTQSPLVGTYGELEKLLFLGALRTSNNLDRENDIVYIGNRRGGARDDVLKEYLVYPETPHSLFGNWDPQEFPSVRGTIHFKETQRELSRHKYALVVSELLYEDVAWRTPRLYEGVLAGTLCFIDFAYPMSNEDLADDFLEVSSGKELKEKMRMLDNDPRLYLKLLQKQSDIARREGYINGEYMRKKLLEVLDGQGTK